MEEKRRESESPSPAAAMSGGSSIRTGESPATEPPPPRRRGQKRKSTTTLSAGSSSAPPKRHAREKANAAATTAAGGGISFFLPPIHNGPLTRARQLSDNNAISSALNAVTNEPLMESSMAALNNSAVAEGKEEVNVVTEDYEALQAAIEFEFETIRCRDNNAHVIPVAAGWFSWTDIHPLEKQALYSFFDGKSESRTPEIYMEIRNWIMKKFHVNPSMNIELKDLLEMSFGDLDAKQDVMEFLDHWGLINYHPFPPNDPGNMDVNPNTDGDKVEKTDPLIDMLYEFESEKSYPRIVLRANSSTTAMPAGLFPESAIAEELAKQEGPSVEYHCNSCSADCSRKRYHCQKQADFDLCTECYNNGKFGSCMTPLDFILMEPGEASGASGGKWTDQETLLLLEALELYKENWNEIAEHVATKTKAQCILHFLQMPIEDSFLDYDNNEDGIQEIAKATLTNNDLSVPKGKSEPSESKTCDDKSEQAENLSGKDNSEPEETKSGKDDREPSESKSDCKTAQPFSSPIETSNPGHVQDGKVTQDKGDEIVLKALNEAFDAIGSPVTPEDKLSFAGAGNPVMALVAFLTKFVEPGIATASARSSLKSMSKSSPGSQLAARHCLLLEDPPDDKKEQSGSDCAFSVKINQSDPELVNMECEDGKEINCNAHNPTNRNEEKPTPSSLDGTPSADDQVHEKKASTAGEDLEPSGRQDLCVGAQVEENPEKKKSQVSENPNETSSIEKALENDQPPINPKDQDDTSKVKPPRGQENESGNTNAFGKSIQCTEVPKDVDMESNPVHSDKKETVPPDPMVEIVSKTGEDKMEVDKTKVPKSSETKDDHNVTKLKRAALATLSAAAVKAKLLATEEEDLIRQLATVLIEKQMRKLEMKLSFFTEMENAMMRIREQLERSRQRLFNERAQIIASRLGLPPSSSRVAPSSFPMNRMPPSVLNSMMRPPMSMAAQRPPMSRPAMSAAPPATNTAVPPEVAGGGQVEPSAK